MPAPPATIKAPVAVESDCAVPSATMPCLTIKSLFNAISYSLVLPSYAGSLNFYSFVTRARSTKQQPN